MAFSMPLILPSFWIDAPRLSVFGSSCWISFTASIEPNDFCKMANCLSVLRCPIFPLMVSRIFGRAFIFPAESKNDKPSFFWAPTAPLINAVYLVAASLPDIVACKVPRTAICSLRETPILAALLPKVLKLSAILLPVVLNICTAVAVCPVSRSTHLDLPIFAADFSNVLYMVPM